MNPRNEVHARNNTHKKTCNDLETFWKVDKKFVKTN